MWQDLKMTCSTRKATAMLAMLFATAAVQPRVIAAGTSPGAKGTQAEIQIGLCSSPDAIVQVLELRPRGTPITVWQFDDTALTLFERGLRLRLRVAADGGSVFTLKVADQDCARLGPTLVPPSEGKCEYDVYGKSMAGAVSLNRSLSEKEHKRPACRSRGAGPGAKPGANPIFARSRPALAVAAWNS